MQKRSAKLRKKNRVDKEFLQAWIETENWETNPSRGPTLFLKPLAGNLWDVLMRKLFSTDELNFESDSDDSDDETNDGPTFQGVHVTPEKQGNVKTEEKMDDCSNEKPASPEDGEFASASPCEARASDLNGGDNCSRVFGICGCASCAGRKGAGIKINEPSGSSVNPCRKWVFVEGKGKAPMDGTEGTCDCPGCFMERDREDVESVPPFPFGPRYEAGETSGSGGTSPADSSSPRCSSPPTPPAEELEKRPDCNESFDGDAATFVSGMGYANVAGAVGREKKKGKSKVTVEKPSAENDHSGENADSESSENEEEFGEDLRVSEEPPRWADMASDSDTAARMKHQDAPEDSSLVTYARFPEKPVYLDEDTYRVRAKKEYLWYLKCKDIAQKSTMLDVIRDYLYGLFHNRKCKTPKDCAFLDYTRDPLGVWAFGKLPERLGHQYAVKVPSGDWTKSHLVALKWKVDDRGRVIGRKPILETGNSSVYMVCEYTWLMNDNIIRDVCMKSMASRKRKGEPRVTLVDGVPGCGKSTYIVSNATLSGPNANFVITIGKEASLDLRDRFLEKGASVEEVKRVKTLDSYLMHDKTSRAKVLHFDEALMAHAGQVYFCADMLSARTVICQGDSKQIPFVRRVEGIRLQYDKIQPDSVEEVRKTFRCPVDVAAWLSKKNFYRSTVMSANPVVRSMKTCGPRHGIRCINNIPKVPKTHYMTFTQAEKESLEKYLGQGDWTVNSIHESQGKTYDHVNLVRLVPTANEIYPGGDKSEPYMIVGITRHRKSVVYYTVKEDKLYDDIEAMRVIQEEKLLKFLHDCDQ